VIMLTSDQDQRTIIKAFRNGVSDYVLKRGLRPEELLAVIQSVLAKRAQEDAAAQDIDRLRRQSSFDDETGMYRRSAVDEKLASIGTSAAHGDGHYAVVLVALNEFESIERRFGHVMAGRVLRAFGARLQAEARATDILGRFASDTFICAIDTMKNPQAVDEIAARFDKALVFEAVLDRVTFHLSASVGFAVYPSDGADPRCLVESAERALASAKERVAVPAAATNGSEPHGNREADAVEQEERRTQRRHRVLKPGKIIINGLNSVVDCTMRDVTRHGARLRVDGHFFAPEQFDLLIVGSGAAKRVRLRWQNGKELGVQFLE
jgi:diguanylate cyclase (GGDEF)-like protein